MIAFTFPPPGKFFFIASHCMIQMKKPFIVELKSLSLISQEPQVELALWKEDKSENDLVQNALKK